MADDIESPFERRLMLQPSVRTAFAAAASVVAAAQSRGAYWAFLSQQPGSPSSSSRAPAPRRLQATSNISCESPGSDIGRAAAVATVAGAVLHIYRNGRVARPRMRMVWGPWRVLNHQVVSMRAARNPMQDDMTGAAPEEFELSPAFLATPPEVAFMVEDIPARSSSSLIIQHRLGSESQYQAVLKLVEEYLPKFDIYNLVSALHKCALSARDNDIIARQIQSDPNFVVLFSTAKSKVLENVQKNEPATLATFLWANARLNIFDSELTGAIALDASQRMHFYSPKAIALIMFSLGYSGVRPRPALMQALVTELKGRNDFDLNSLTIVLYGCMRLGIRNEKILKLVAEHLDRTQMKDASPLDLACLCYAFAKLEYWDKSIMSLLGKRVVQEAKEFTPQMLSMAGLCFAASAAHMQETASSMETMLRTVEDRMSEFAHRDLSTIAFAVGKFRYLTKVRTLEEEFQGTIDNRLPFASNSSTEKDPIVVKLLDEVNRREMESFTMQELNLINYALMRMDHRDPVFLESAARLFEANAAELMHIEIVNVLYSYGKNKFLHVGLVKGMIEEIVRRNELEEMDTLAIATFAYSLAVHQVRQEDIMDRIAEIGCEKVRDFSPQQLAMLVWSMAVLNCRNNAEALVSAIAEEMASDLARFDHSSICIIMWACSILSGPAGGLWMLKIFFSQSFWTREFTNQGYTMLYHLMVSLNAEMGLPIKELKGYYICRQIYEESMRSVMGQQHARLSERLRLQRIPHQANAMAPQLEGFPEAGVVVDVAIPKLKLVIEVEGPQRSTIPLEKLKEKLEEEGGSINAGEIAEVLTSAREFVECGLTGAAAFKRRLLRKCGWRVITVTFDESEEYIADALEKMIKKDQPPDAAVLPTDDPSLLGMLTPPGAAMSEVPDYALPNEAKLSPYEEDLRVRHRRFMKELELRIARERGNAASFASYPSYLEYRKWQVRQEKQILADMIAELTTVNA